MRRWIHESRFVNLAVIPEAGKLYVPGRESVSIPPFLAKPWNPHRPIHQSINPPSTPLPTFTACSLLTNINLTGRLARFFA